MIQKYECGFCKAKFQRESTLGTHICVRKRRHLEIDSIASRFGFRAFQRFYDISTVCKKTKTIEEFIESDYYIQFVKFGHHLAALRPVYPDQFIDFIIRNGIKLKDWTTDYVYYAYVDDLVKREPAIAAIDRSIGTMMEWATANNVEFVKFFSMVSPNEASSMIQTGKISPWVLYLSSSAGVLMNAFNGDHVKIIGSIIDAVFWMKKFKKNSDEVIYIRDLLTQAGL